MAEITVVNVVASASIGKELMLQDIAFQLEGAESAARVEAISCAIIK